MIKVLFKLGVYIILILIILEVLVRVFHLHNDMPIRYTAKDGTYKWIPGQHGYTVYGNRRQNFAEYKINKSGFNSYREFKPTKERKEIALIGDSFIEGFHQNYFNSIGKKIENEIKGIEVYEYGHSSNDLADQLYLIHSNKSTFELIDHIIIGIKYKNDLARDEYKFIERKPFFPLLRNSKLVVYLLNIGITDPIKEIHSKLRNLKSNAPKINSKPIIDKDSLYLENFKILINKYDFDKTKVAFLLDTRVTNQNFINYLKKQNISYIDYSISFKKSKKPTDLIYDMHWNNNGRTIIANDIIDFIKPKL